MNTFRKFALSTTAIVLLSGMAHGAAAYYQPVESLSALAVLGAASPGILHADVLNVGKYDWYSASLSSAFAPQNAACPGTTDGKYLITATGISSTSCWVRQITPSSMIFATTSAVDCGSDAACAILGHVNISAVTINSVAGEADYDWQTDRVSCITDYIRPAGTSAGQFCRIPPITPDITYEQYGAKGDGQRRYDCSAPAAYLTISCTGYTFASSDIGKVITVQWAGATLTGGQNHPFISTIAGISSGNAVLAAPLTNPPSGPTGSGPFFVKFGTDDTAAIQRANSATVGQATCISAGSHKNYLVTGQIVFGGSANTPHCFKLNNAGFDSVISNNTTDNFFASGAGAPSNGTYPGISFWPLHFENGYFDCGDTGRDCFVLGNAAASALVNFKINNSYRNGFAVEPQAWVDALNLNNFTVMNSGHHAFYVWLNPAYAVNGSYFNVVHGSTVELTTFGLNSCAILHAAGGPACPWSSWSTADKTAYNVQLGAGMYFINGQNSGPFSWQTYEGVAIQPGSPLAQAWGSNINPNAVVYADGTQAHLIEGAGVAGASLGVKGFTFIGMDTEDPNNFYSPTLSDGGSNCFRGETAAVDAVVMQHTVLGYTGSAYCDSRKASWGNHYGNIYNGPAAPTYTVLKTGTSATYTTPLGATQLEIEECGGGGGGAGGGASGTAGTGAAGSDTSFDGIVASKGGGSAQGQGSGLSGTGAGTALFRVAGNSAGAPGNSINGVSVGTGSSGGSGPWGGAGQGLAGIANGGTAAANSCAGGGGGGVGSSVSGVGGGGGGAGEYVKIIIDAPAATYTYTVGPGGAGGTAGTSGGAGGDGGTGVIRIKETY